LRIIAEGGLDGGSVPKLASRLGVGDRHLRRLFQEHLGASPLAVAQTRRLLFAKRLLDDTALPLTEVALASGFASVRRLQALCRDVYGVGPRRLRNSNGHGGGHICLRLPITTPYHWEGIIGFLGPRAIPGVELVSAESYRRAIQGGSIEVNRPDAGTLPVTIELSDLATLRDLIERCGRLFDIRADVAAIAGALRGLAPAPGIRVPGAWDPFELIMRAMLGQQISVAAATTLAGRIVERFGGRLPQEPPNRLFPSAAVLASAPLAGIGLPSARAESIRSVARAFAEGRLRLDQQQDLEQAVAHLCQFDGIGEWTAHYIAMRALRHPDAFPASDLGLRRAAGQIPAQELDRRSQAWRPWRAYAAMTLWEKH
jgi:AraC family transcriptional regulator of adaptative response / DNA-3-methyladenine glycosylase II